MTEAATTSNRMLERVALVLDAVDDSSASASELARRTGLSVSTVHRLALSMADYGFLRRNDDGDFKLGHRFVRTALESVAQPILTELRNALGRPPNYGFDGGKAHLPTVGGQPTRIESYASRGFGFGATQWFEWATALPDPEALESVAAHGWVESVGRRTPGLGASARPSCCAAK